MCIICIMPAIRLWIEPMVKVLRICVGSVLQVVVGLKLSMMNLKPILGIGLMVEQIVLDTPAVPLHIKVMMPSTSRIILALR